MRLHLGQIITGLTLFLAFCLITPNKAVLAVAGVMCIASTANLLVAAVSLALRKEGSSWYLVAAFMLNLAMWAVNYLLMMAATYWTSVGKSPDLDAMGAGAVLLCFSAGAAYVLRDISHGSRP